MVFDVIQKALQAQSNAANNRHIKQSEVVHSKPEQNILEPVASSVPQSVTISDSQPVLTTGAIQSVASEQEKDDVFNQVANMIKQATVDQTQVITVPETPAQGLFNKKRMDGYEYPMIKGGEYPSPRCVESKLILKLNILNTKFVYTILMLCFSKYLSLIVIWMCGARC